mmetsp:Transcript_87213/g.244727  ORF Transcript_87213/g.244727 Transcript_87213/m.244727 type:complete len:295 (-) Transcript_87213:91-975(-)
MPQSRGFFFGASAALVALAALIPAALELFRQRRRLPCEVVGLGSKVELNYTLVDERDGSRLDAGLVEFVVGDDSDVPFAMDEGVRGMRVGESKQFPFGGGGELERRDDWVVFYEREAIEQHLPPDKAALEVGDVISVQGSQATIASLNETSVELDFNHPLAGRNVVVVASLVSCDSTVAASRGVPEAVEVEGVSPGDNATFPKHGDRVTIECTGSFAESGEVFYSTEERGAAYEFQIGERQAIRGLEIGVQRLSLGEHARIRIPAALAYGQQSKSVALPMARDVVFDVKVLAIA